jgi:hypothetical protein
MKCIWLAGPTHAVGSMVSSWKQSYGVSRNERSGRWTLYDRRDDGSTDPEEGGVWIITNSYADVDTLLDELLINVDSSVALASLSTAQDRSAVILRAELEKRAVADSDHEK